MVQDSDLNKIVDDLKSDQLISSYEPTRQSHGTRHRTKTVRAFKATGNRPRGISADDSESSTANAMEDEVQAHKLVVCCKNRAIVSTFQGRDWPQWSNLLGLFCVYFCSATIEE